MAVRRFKVGGMDCGSCALTIENALRQLPGVESATVSFTAESLEVAGGVPDAVIEQRIRELGYRLAPDAPVPPIASAPDRRGLGGFLRFLWSQPRLRLASAVTATMAGVAALHYVAPASLPARVLDLAFVVAVLIVGAPVLVKGLRALLFARRVTIDLLMTVASIGALLIGATGEAVTVILLYTLGEALEAYSAERARDSLRSLLSLQPLEALVLREGGHDGPHDHDHGDHDDHGHCGQGHDHHDHGHGHGHDHGHDDHGHGGNDHHDHDHAVAHEHAHDDHAACGSHGPSAVSVPVDAVHVGETVLVKPGQRVPIDGRVLRGSSSVNQAAITGESMPVERGEGDEVLAGSVNGAGALEVQVLRRAQDSTLARIAKLVELAQSRRSPAETFIDRFAAWYTPAVVLLAVLVVAVPVLVLGQPLLDSAAGHGWLYRGLALLIVACPCALVISIPVTVVSALTRLAGLGVLVKGGSQLDCLADLRVVAFDKTGTLTGGRPTVTTVRGLDCEHEPAADPGCERCDDVVALAASVESASEHPVAHAIVSIAQAHHLERRYGRPQAVTAHAGRGVTGRLGNGQQVAVGSDAMFADHAAQDATLAADVAVKRAAGNTVMFVARDARIVGYIGVRDELRDTSRRALEELKQDASPPWTAMLTGDSPEVAAAIAGSVGALDEVRAGLMPEAKLRAIEELRERHGPVAMVGDGINDAPALARADVGIAMGRGTAQAMETADIVLMQDDLSQLPAALRIARRARRLVKQNIALSLGLKIAFLLLAIPGIATLWMAVVADVGTTLLVTLNGMRLLKAR